MNKYKIEWELINEFIESMELDLEKQDYEISLYVHDGGGYNALIHHMLNSNYLLIIQMLNW